MKKLIRAIVIALFVISASANVLAIPPAASIQKVKQSVESLRYQLPIDIGYGLNLTQVSYDSQRYTLVYRYQYTMYVEKPSNDAIWEAKQSMIHMAKINPNSEEMQLLRDGFTFHYNYYSMGGEFLYAIKITYADVR